MDQFQKGDLDRSMKGIIDICNQKLFGVLANEKKILQITVKTKEAQKLKSYDIYEISIVNRICICCQILI